MSTPRIYRVIGTYTPRRPSFLVKAEEVTEANGHIVDISGSFRLTAANGKSVRNDPNLNGLNSRGLFDYNSYTFRLLKRKSI